MAETMSKSIEEVRKWWEKQKGIDILKAVNFMGRMLTKDGGVLSHEGSRPLPSPSAISLLGLIDLNNWLKGERILSQKELELRAKWLASLENWTDWEGHDFNCFAAGTCIWALDAAMPFVKNGELRRKMKASILKAAKLLNDHFNERLGAWSWHKNVKPAYPIYTFVAQKGLEVSKKYTTDRKFLRVIKQRRMKVVRFFKTYLREGKSGGQKSVCLWGLYELGEKVRIKEEHLRDIYLTIEKMEEEPLHTEPIEFYFQFVTPLAVIPLILLAPQSEYTRNAVKKVVRWIKEKQNEGWGWGHVKKDNTWTTGWIFKVLSTIYRNPYGIKALT